MQLTKEHIADWFKDLQDDICQQLTSIDGEETFYEDQWQRPGGGGGRSRVITDGGVIEKGGVNFSAVHGKMPDNILKALQLPANNNFFATGVSIVLHPYNPFMPIIHMNVRYFEIPNTTYWFGGGIDLTPHYINPEDGKYFHQALKRICDMHDTAYYPAFKKWADDYFYLQHRNETRGVGGIFFDRLNSTTQPKHTKDEIWAFVQAVGKLFAPTYKHYADKYAQAPFSEVHQAWQNLRRSRYVEFNLVYDKGTKFGLDTNGRTESILMSMPPVAQWEYNYQPPENSPEAITQEWLKKDIDWINLPT